VALIFNFDSNGGKRNRSQGYEYNHERHLHQIQRENRSSRLCKYSKHGQQQVQLSGRLPGKEAKYEYCVLVPQ